MEGTGAWVVLGWGILVDTLAACDTDAIVTGSAVRGDSDGCVGTAEAAGGLGDGTLGEKLRVSKAGDEETGAAGAGSLKRGCIRAEAGASFGLGGAGPAGLGGAGAACEGTGPCEVGAAAPAADVARKAGEAAAVGGA